MLHLDFRDLLGQVGGHWVEGRSCCRSRHAKLGQFGNMGLHFLLLAPCVACVEEVRDLYIPGAAVGKFEAENRHGGSILCVYGGEKFTHRKPETVAHVHPVCVMYTFNASVTGVTLKLLVEDKHHG